jgi:hypothetical protein
MKVVVLFVTDLKCFFRQEVCGCLSFTEILLAFLSQQRHVVS